MPMSYLLDALFVFLLPVVLLIRRKRRAHLWSRFLGRTGMPTDSRVRAAGCGLQPTACSRSVWFHGVSVGEIHLLRGVIARFQNRFPDYQIVVSSTTEAGFAEAKRCFPTAHVIRWPLDCSWAVARAIREVDPELVVLAESEWWPNFLLAAKRAGVPVVAINVRMSPRSARRYRRFRPITRRWLSLVSHFAVQTSEYASQLKDLGVPAERITITGSVKYDGAKTDRNNSKTLELRRLLQIHENNLIWIAGSTQTPEEQIALAIFRKLQPEYPNLRLILAPRQPDRFNEVAELLHRSGANFARRSESKPLDKHVILLDTIGELGAAWGLADIAFVGGSLDGQRGGQNMIEPAAYGAAVVFGPHTWNFRDAVRRMIDADAAIEVRDAAALEAAIRQLLSGQERRRQLGENARKLVCQQQGATERTLDSIDIYMASILAPPSRIAS